MVSNDGIDVLGIRYSDHSLEVLPSLIVFRKSSQKFRGFDFEDLGGLWDTLDIECILSQVHNILYSKNLAFTQVSHVEEMGVFGIAMNLCHIIIKLDWLLVTKVRVQFCISLYRQRLHFNFPGALKFTTQNNADVVGLITLSIKSLSPNELLLNERVG